MTNLFHHPIQIVLLRDDVVQSKNAGATYEQRMLKCFGDLIRHTIEAYIDDIVVKSK
jgi:hypothetical protein